jgi:hypothetical protein
VNINPVLRSGRFARFLLFNQFMVFQRYHELAYVACGNFSGYVEFPTKTVDNFRLGVSTLQQLKDSGSNEIEVEYLTLSNIQDNCAILGMGAANGIGNSVHRTPHNAGLFGGPDSACNLSLCSHEGQ